MKKTLDSNAIKLIAIIAMTIDHIAWVLFPGYPREAMPIVMHLIGRITCPVMCFCIAEGYHHTRNVGKYTLRLFVFAFISHFAYVFFSANYVDARSFIPFYFGSLFDQTSVMWPLAWGLVMLRTASSARLSSGAKTAIVLLICLVTFPSDWSCIASLFVLAFGTNRGDPRSQMRWMLLYGAIYAAVYFFALDPVYGIVQLGVVLAIPVLAMYNGKRGGSPAAGKVLKWLFYIYYPAHLLVLGLCKSVF